MCYQNFLSLQVKRSAIVSNNHGVFKLPQKLPNDLRKIVKTSEISKLARIIN